jgi:hypothetical protein
MPRLNTVNKIKLRSLQIQLTVDDKSVVTPDNTRDVKPDTSD